MEHQSNHSKTAYNINELMNEKALNLDDKNLFAIPEEIEYP